jgi:chromosome segregation ATPase
MNLQEIDAKAREIDASRSSNEARVADLDRRREAIAAAAVTGDAAAAEEMASIERDTVELAAERQTLDALRRALEAERAAEEARLAEEKDRERQAQARVVAAELLTASAEADEAASALAQALARRWELASRLQGLGGTRGNVIFHKNTVDRAIAFSGLGEFVHLPYARQGEPLAMLDRRSLSHLVPTEVVKPKKPLRGLFGWRAIRALARQT